MCCAPCLSCAARVVSGIQGVWREWEPRHAALSELGGALAGGGLAQGLGAGQTGRAEQVGTSQCHQVPWLAPLTLLGQAFGPGPSADLSSRLLRETSPIL